MTGSCTANVSMTMDTTHVLPGMKSTIRKMSPVSSDDDEPRMTNKSLFSSAGGEKKRLYEQQDDDAAAPFSKLTSTFFGVGERRSCPSEKSFMLSSSSKLPFSNDPAGTSASRQRSTSSAADVAVQKIGCLMNTWKHEREGGYHKAQERYSEPSISCSSSNTGGGTETSSFSKLSALRAARHERASSHGSTGSDESRTRVLNVLGRASEIIKSIDTATKSNTTETDDDNVRPRQGVRQRRLAVFNLCDTIMMEDEEEKQDEPVEDEVGMVCSTDEDEPQLSLKTTCGFRLSEPRIMNKQRRATGSSTSTTTARDVIDLLERHRAAVAAGAPNDFLALETRQLSSSSSASSCGSTSSNTSLREPDEMVASISSSSTMSY